MSRLISILAMLALLVPTLGTSAVALAAAGQNVPSAAAVACDELPSDASYLVVAAAHDNGLCAESQKCAVHAGSCCPSMMSWSADVSSTFGSIRSSSHTLPGRAALNGITPPSHSGPPKHTA